MNTTEKPTIVLPKILNNDENIQPLKVLSERRILINNKSIKQYLVRYKNSLADKDKWLEAKDIPNSDTLLRNFRVSKRN